MEATWVLCGFTKVMWTPTTSRYHFRFSRMIIVNECKYDYGISSERDTERLRYGYRIDPEGDRSWLPSIITEISQWGISLQKDFTWRSNERITGSPTGQSHCWRCLLNGILKDQENYGQTAYQRIKKQWRNGIPKESRITSPEAYQMTTGKPTDILLTLPTEMAAE
jgi:hypothetical protein